MTKWKEKLLKETSNKKILNILGNLDLSEDKQAKLILLIKLLKAGVPTAIVTPEGEPLTAVFGKLRDLNNKRWLVRDLFKGLSEDVLHIGVFRGHKPGDPSVAVAGLKWRKKTFRKPHEILTGKYANVGREKLVVIKHENAHALDKFLSPEIKLVNAGDESFLKVYHGGFAVLTDGTAYNLHRLWTRYITYSDWLMILSYITETQDYYKELIDAYTFRYQEVLERLVKYMHESGLSFWQAARGVIAVSKMVGVEKVIVERVLRYIARSYGYNEYEATRLTDIIYELTPDEITHIYATHFDEHIRNRIKHIIRLLSSLSMHTSALSQLLDETDAVRRKAFDAHIGSVYVIPVVNKEQVKEIVLITLFSRGTLRGTAIRYPAKYEEIKNAYLRILVTNVKPGTFIDIAQEAIGHISIKTNGVDYNNLNDMLDELDSLIATPIYRQAAKDVTYKHSIVKDKSGYLVISDKLIKNLMAKYHINLQLGVIKHLICYLLDGFIWEYEHSNIIEGRVIFFNPPKDKISNKLKSILDMP